jgi:hypothetical protein
LVLFIALPETEKQDRPGVTSIPLELLPRRCPFCSERTIIGHGQRLKQAHDQRHQKIWIRRGLCRPCRKTFTVLPDWSPPSEKLPQGREGIAWPQVLELLVVNRLIDPGSEFRLHRHWFDHSAMDVFVAMAVAEFRQRESMIPLVKKGQCPEEEKRFTFDATHAGELPPERTPFARPR